MQKDTKKTASKSKKAYSKPKLATHGDVRKLTQHGGKSIGMGSGIFDHGDRDRDHGHDEGHH